jgi:hypothetical protein
MMPRSEGSQWAYSTRDHHSSSLPMTTTTGWESNHRPLRVPRLSRQPNQPAQPSRLLTHISPALTSPGPNRYSAALGTHRKKKPHPLLPPRRFPSPRHGSQLSPSIHIASPGRYAATQPGSSRSLACLVLSCLAVARFSGLPSASMLSTWTSRACRTCPTSRPKPSRATAKKNRALHNGGETPDQVHPSTLHVIRGT